jgi:hypothetical protein
MKILDRWRLGAKALELASAVRTALRDIDGYALLEAVAQVTRLERELSAPGQGREKFDRLVDWFVATWPQYAQRVDTLATVVRTLVALYNAVGVFRSVNGSATSEGP